MLPRVLEPEVMDTPDEARDYDAMDHGQVNRAFVNDLLAFWSAHGSVLDIGTGTAQIPIELCRRNAAVRVVGVDLAEHMLAVGRANIRRAGLDARIVLHCFDAKQLPLQSAAVDAVISNSIVHHIPEPVLVFAEVARVIAPGGIVFVRDLVRPASNQAVQALVDAYARDANQHQRKMFEDSLRASLTLDEVRGLVQDLGFDPGGVAPTSDRH